MKHRNLWFGLVIILIAAIGLTACSDGAHYEYIEPAEKVDQGDGRYLLILTDKAVERLGIETENVIEEEIELTRTFGGEVMETSADGGAMVMVSLTADELGLIDPNGPVSVFPLGDDDEEDDDDEGFEAEWDEMPGMDDDEDGVTKAVYYSVAGADLATGQRLMVEVSLMGDEGSRLVVPFSSLIYDIYGDTWVYTNPESRNFLRVPVVVDFIQGEKVVLVDGPAAGTTLVTVGVAELHGADTGVGK
ncbi:MAG: hypothetical protein ACYS8X_14095 [Planctomycetota bacterium]|jgi:hypothetical protein